MTKKDRVIVIGGGESVASMPPEYICDKGWAIGVNDSAIYAPVNECLSMDRRWAEWRYEALKKRNIPVVLRRSAAQNLPSFEAGQHYSIFECNHESDDFAEAEGYLNGRNSGFCAFNLAYQYRPKEIFLFGLDMSMGYWYPPYPWVNPKQGNSRILETWVQGFAAARKKCDEAGIKVYIVGASRVTDFDKLTYGEFIELCEK